MKRVAAGIITAAVLASTLLSMRSWSPELPLPHAAPDQQPDECLGQMMAAAEAGDVDAYMACFTGDERQRVERELKGTTRESFARALVEAIQPLKGWAVSRPSDGTPDADRVTLSLERIFSHRIERQQFELVRQGRQWRISRALPSVASQPDMPYGTLVE